MRSGCINWGDTLSSFRTGDIQLGRGESLADTARVLSRYVDGIMIRTYGQAEVEELARLASIPVINGLTDLLHPCQVLADLLTVVEEFDLSPHDLRELSVAWIGDGNNVANSWINAALVFGFELRLASPAGYGPDGSILSRAVEGGARISSGTEVGAAAEGARVVTTDVWASMGQEEEAETRVPAFQGFRVNEELMAVAHPEAVFLHCLPAHRGEEVAAGGDRRTPVEGVSGGREQAPCPEGPPARTTGVSVHGR